MQSFEWVDAASVEQATTLLAKGDISTPVVAKAGGMDLLDLMKEGIISPARVVNLKSIRGLNGLSFSQPEGLNLGTLVTLARIATAPEIRQHYVALADAAAHASTPQVRNAATIGGNLLQRPRCWYFRSEHFHHTGRDIAGYVRDGENQYHAIFDNAQSAIVHASTPATALVAYDARVELSGPQGKQRTVAVKDFFLAPDASRERDTVMERGPHFPRLLLRSTPAQWQIRSTVRSPRPRRSSACRAHRTGYGWRWPPFVSSY